MSAANPAPVREALSSYGEARIKTEIGDIMKLPEFREGLTMLKEQIRVENPRDVQVFLPDMKMDEDAFLIYQDQSYKYTKHGLNQLVSRIKPEGTREVSNYFAVCPPPLRSLNYNWWHDVKFAGGTRDEKPNHAVFRIRDDDDNSPMVRGVVSTTYVPIDDLPIMQRLGLILPNGCRVRLARGDLKSRYTIFMANSNGQIDLGDPVQVAIYLSTSETGISSIWMEPMVRIAEHGGSVVLPMRDPEVRIRHVGEAQERLAKAMVKTVEATGPFMIKLRESNSDDVANLTQDTNVMFDALAAAFDFSAGKMVRIKAEYNAMNGHTRGALVSAISKVANELDVTTGEEMQRAAGRLVDSGWKILKSSL